MEENDSYMSGGAGLGEAVGPRSHGSGKMLSVFEGADDARSGLSTAFEDLASEARGYIESSKAANTRRAYKSDWEDFAGWCRHHRVSPLPALPSTVAIYLTDCAKGLKVSTIERRLSTISQAHLAAGYADSPTKHASVRAVWQGIKREKGTRAQGKAPALTADIRAMVEKLEGIEEGKKLALRDRCLLVIGFAGAMRRSELVGLDMEDVVESSDGLIVTIRRSKTDQEGAGRKVGLPYGSTPLTCPVRSLRAWIAAGGIESGPLFREVDRHGNVGLARLSDQMVAKVVKKAVVSIGKDAAKFAGHSLRAGLATQAAMSGASERSIQDQTGHKSLPVLRRYIRDGSLFRENAAAKVGL